MEGKGKHTKIGKSFGVGVVGLGEGKGVVKGLHGHPELKIQAVCDTDKTLTTEIREMFNIPNGYEDINDLLKHKDIHIVLLYTPDQLHVQHIRACFESGKHVICTKPLVTSQSEAAEIMKIKKQYPHLQLMVGQSSRFFGPMLKQREAYDTGKLGELSFAETQYVHDMRWFYNNRPWAREGGFDLLFACASHPVDLIRWYMGDVAEVHAFGDRSLIAKDADFKERDIFTINLKFENGKIGRVLGLYGLEHLHQTRPWIEVALYGNQGTFIAKYPQLQANIKYNNGVEHVEHYFEDIYHYFQYEGVNHHAGEFVNYTEYFARCLVKGETAMPDAVDGFKTMATLEAARKSMNENKAVKVERYVS
ncbi:MAG: hypothetical protein GF313_10625 [Caldithrix sp.]|nr:hypothetical protein [Caldithrix sp.]